MLAIQLRTRPPLVTKGSALLQTRGQQRGSDILICELFLFFTQDFLMKSVLERLVVFTKVLSMNQDQLLRILWMGVQRRNKFLSNSNSQLTMIFR